MSASLLNRPVTKRILHSLSASVFGNILNIGIQVLGVPILLNNWGVEYYGAWLVIFAVPSYIAMSDIGLGTIASTEINIFLAKDNETAARELFNQTFFFILRIGFVSTAFFIISLFFFPYLRWLNILQITKNELIITSSLLAGYAFLALVLTLPQGIYRSLGHYARGQYIISFFRGIEFSIFLAATFWGARHTTAGFIFFSVRLVQCFFLFYDLNKITSIAHITFTTQFDKVKPIFKPSLSMMINYLGQNLIVQGSTIIVSSFLGSTQVVIFSTVRTLSNFAKQLISIVNLSFFGEFTTAYAKRDKLLFEKLYKRANQIVLLTTFLTVIFLLIFGKEIIYLWTKGKITIDGWFYPLYLLTILFNSFWFVGWTTVVAINKHQSTSIVFLGSCIVSLTIVLVLMNIYKEIWVIPISLIFIDIMMFFSINKALKLLNIQFDLNSTQN